MCDFLCTFCCFQAHKSLDVLISHEFTLQLLDRLGLNMSSAGAFLETAHSVAREVLRYDALVRETLDEMLAARQEQIGQVSRSVRKSYDELVAAVREVTHIDALVTAVKDSGVLARGSHILNAAGAVGGKTGGKKPVKSGATAEQLAEEDFELLVLCSLVTLLSLLLLIRYHRHLRRMQQQRAAAAARQ